METVNYKEYIKTVIDAGIPASMIFDYEHIQDEELYDQYFNWCIESLKNYSSNFGVEPSYFFYWDSVVANAGAVYHNGSYFIRVSKGYMTRLNEKLGIGSMFFKNSSLAKYQELQGKIEDSLELLLFQCATVYTFHHEFAHLVQKHKVEFNLNEAQENEFDFERHVFEYDADLNGCQFVSMLTQSYYETLPNEVQNEDNLKLFLYIGISSMVLTSLLFLNGEMEPSKPMVLENSFYTKEKTHPHSYIRIAYIIAHYVKNAKANKVDLDLGETLGNVLLICNEFFKGTDIFQNFIADFEKHQPEIDEYDLELYGATFGNAVLIKNKAHLFGFEIVDDY